MDSTNKSKGYYQQKKPYRNKQTYYKKYQNNHQSSTAYEGRQQREYINPYLAQEMIYRTEIYICTKYRNLIDINVKNQGLSTSIEDSSSFYVIKSFSEEDVHKSIKYGVWSSSKTGNQTLSNSFKLTKEKNGFVYLFFSCNGSGRFVGVAKMKTPCDNDKNFDYWTQDGKWPGLFEVEWMFIKDVPFKEFKNIIITMRDGETKPVSNSRDVQEIPFEHSKTMIEIFEKYQNVNTILEHFEYYDMRQDNYEKSLKMQKAQQEQQQQQQTTHQQQGQQEPQI